MKTHSSKKEDIRQTIDALGSLWRNFYDIKELLERRVQEFSACPAVVQTLSTLANQPFDVIERLKQLRDHVAGLSRDLHECESEIRSQADEKATTWFEDLSPAELSGLHLLNEKFDVIGQHVHTAAKRIEEAMAASCADPSDPMIDYEVEPKLSFHLREDDLGYREDSDNIVAEVELKPDRAIEQWPDGYDEMLPFPHGGVLHEARLYGGCMRAAVDYRDLLRVGMVWVDIVVMHQFCYDLVERRWVKPRPEPIDGSAHEQS